MFEKCVAKLCILFICSLFMSGCAETIKAAGQDTANILRKITGSSDQQTVKVKSTLKSVDVRKDPSTTSPVVVTVPGGLEVLKISENADWVQVRLDMEDGTQMEGWISKKMVEDVDTTTSEASQKKVNQQEQVKEVDPSTQKRSQEKLDQRDQVKTVRVKSTLKSANVRKNPSTTSPVVVAVPGGLEILKISENVDWVQVRLDMEDGTQVDGWISKKVVD